MHDKIGVLGFDANGKYFARREQDGQIIAQNFEQGGLKIVTPDGVEHRFECSSIVGFQLKKLRGAQEINLLHRRDGGIGEFDAGSGAYVVSLGIWSGGIEIAELWVNETNLFMGKNVVTYSLGKNKQEFSRPIERSKDKSPTACRAFGECRHFGCGGSLVLVDRPSF